MGNCFGLIEKRAGGRNDFLGKPLALRVPFLYLGLVLDHVKRRTRQIRVGRHTRDDGSEDHDRIKH